MHKIAVIWQELVGLRTVSSRGDERCRSLGFYRSSCVPVLAKSSARLSSIAIEQRLCLTVRLSLAG